jgi:hypothetical protein
MPLLTDLAIFVFQLSFFSSQHYQIVQKYEFFADIEQNLLCLCLIIFKKCQATDLNCFEQSSHLLKRFFTFLFQGVEKAGNINVILLFFNFVSTLPSGVSVVLVLPNLDLLRTVLFCFCSFH